MILMLNPRKTIADDGNSVIFEACFSDPDLNRTCNESVARHLLDKASDLSSDYEEIPLLSIPLGKELIPEEVAQKSANPIKSLTLLTALDHPEIEEAYPRGCIRIVCSDESFLQNTLGSINSLATFNKDDLIRRVAWQYDPLR